MAEKLINLLSKFRPRDDRESETAFFLTSVPWVAPQAYLNIIFKAAPANALKISAEGLELPESFCELLRIQNGAILFSGALSIYGVHRRGQLLNRSDTFSRLPFNIEPENLNWPCRDPDRLVAIGGYGFDGSRVCVDKRSLRIELCKRDADRASSGFSWKSIDEWIFSEITRLSMLFDEHGKLLVSESDTLPRSATRLN